MSQGPKNHMSKQWSLANSLPDKVCRAGSLLAWVPSYPGVPCPESRGLVTSQCTGSETVIGNGSMKMWVKSQRWGCLVTWFCYHLIAKPGNEAAATLWPDPYTHWLVGDVKVTDTVPHKWGVNIGLGNGLALPGNKPLPEAVLTQIQVTICRK